MPESPMNVEPRPEPLPEATIAEERACIEKLLLLQRELEGLVNESAAAARLADRIALVLRDARPPHPIERGGQFTPTGYWGLSQNWR